MRQDHPLKDAHFMVGVIPGTVRQGQDIGGDISQLLVLGGHPIQRPCLRTDGFSSGQRLIRWVWMASMPFVQRWASGLLLGAPGRLANDIQPVQVQHPIECRRHRWPSGVAR